ncbi:MAG: aminopeptidase P N-terminal domain-containing protein [Defluviitaleaceae bacterium]|nr:aminopeptidase P N-terminal domain-containing protein [Defluviitaleaceae bacterium]
MSKLFTDNRNKIADKLENGSMLIIFGGVAPVKRGDEFYPFAPQRNFYYATGIERPNLVFTMMKVDEGNVKSRLYLERYDEHVAKWDGAALDVAMAKEISGMEDFAYIDELYGHVGTAMTGRLGKIHTVYLDLENRSLTAPNTPDLDFAKLLGEKFPDMAIKNAHPIFASVRVVKSPEEVEHMKKAAEITGEGFTALLRNAKPGMMEYELEAHLDYVYKKNGCRDRAFRTIMAGGKNACVLHYGDNNCKINDGDLVLVDYGAQWKWYSADVSRTFPVNGKFTDRQKLLYNIVLGGLKLCLDMIKPGVVFGKLQESLQAYYVEELTKIGLISDKEELGKYYFHGVAHMLGLETHDVGSNKDLVMAPGMVFTVEPGLYIAEEGIGIRIEDNVVVTETGYDNLTAHIIKEVDDIEAFMAQNG